MNSQSEKGIFSENIGYFYLQVIQNFPTIDQKMPPFQSFTENPPDISHFDLKPRFYCFTFSI